MSKGRHRKPVEHRLGKAIVTSSAAATIGTGALLAVTPTPASAAGSPVVAQVVPRVAISLVPASAVVPVPTTYTVAPGDFLGRIGSQVGEPWQQLYNDNVGVIGADPNRIFPGQVLAVGTTSAAPQQAPAAAPTPAHSAGQAAVDLARHELGDPYVWGAAGPNAFDCSGLVQYVYRQLDVNLPHSSAMQSTIGDRVGSLDQAEPGDLLFFYSPVGHVGIYVGNGRMIAAPEPGDVVKEQSVWATPTVIRRVL